MIARFQIFLPFDLFITDEEQIGVHWDVSNPALLCSGLSIPIAWGYAERPNPTGTIHEVAFDWLSKVSSPVFSETCLYDSHRVARVNVLLFELTAGNFDRTREDLLEDAPLIQSAYEAANSFLGKLRVFARLPQIRTLTPAHDPWQVQFLTDDGKWLPREDGKLRMARKGQAAIGVFAFRKEAIETVNEKWKTVEPYLWDQLLLDAQSLWPNIGSSIVTAFSALETFIAWALETLQESNRTFPDDGWKWIIDRGNFLKDPSVEEQYDTLLSILGTKSLKSEPALWVSFKELKDARNSLVHTGLAQFRNGTLVDAPKARTLINGAEKIIEWVEALLPETHRRHNKGFAVPASRKFATEEEALSYGRANESDAQSVPPT